MGGRGKISERIQIELHSQVVSKLVETCRNVKRNIIIVPYQAVGGGVVGMGM